MKFSELPFLKQLTNGSRNVHPRHLIPDLIVICISLFLSLYLRVGLEGMDEHLETAIQYLPVFLLVRFVTFVFLNVYNIYWRYVSASDAFHIARAAFLSSAIIIAISFLMPDGYARLPRSVYFIDAVVLTMGLFGARLLRRLLYESKTGKKVRSGRRTLIYGAGVNGKFLAQRFSQDLSLNSYLVGFIDDDKSKLGISIGDARVIGNRKLLDEVLRDYEIEQVYIAIPNLPGDVLREVVLTCAKFNIRPRITSKFTTGEEATRRDIEIARKIELNDLLNRKPKNIDLRPVQDLIRGKKVLVTGAGGSIGSELARQVLQNGPARLFLLDHSEYNLFEIDKELRMSTQSTEKVVPLMVDIKDRTMLEQVYKRYAPEVVFHAAAYKHVHLVEANPYPAILNNILGTKNVVDLSKQMGVENFLMISTDKAVNPAGVMGATKRVCELIVTAAALETRKRYVSVRFGNVLGSSGSLIPTLQKQIYEGGPVTVTHKDMTRYFMLIPEAVSLVLTACTLAQPGDINVLKMGEPVKILDIAKNLIVLNGKTEDEIPIVFTGPRPGEKLFEELYIRGDELKTDHPDILSIPYGDSNLTSDPSALEKLKTQVSEMIDLATQSSDKSLHILNTLVKPNYGESSSSTDRIQ